MNIAREQVINMAIICIPAPFFVIYANFYSANMFTALFAYFVAAFLVAKIIPVVVGEIKNCYLPNGRMAMRSIKKLRPFVNRPDSANLLYCISVLFLLVAFVFFTTNPKGWVFYIWQFFAFSFLLAGALLDLSARVRALINSRLAKFAKIVGSFVFGTFFAYVSSVFSDWMINDATHLSGKNFPALFALLSAWMTPLLWVLLLQATLMFFSLFQVAVFIIGHLLNMIGEQFVGAFLPKIFGDLKDGIYRLRYGEKPSDSKILLKTIGATASPFGMLLIVFVFSLLTGSIFGSNAAIRDSLAKFIVFSEYHSISDCENIKGPVKAKALDGNRFSVASYDSNGVLKFESVACVLPASS